jgi:pyridoxal phosphate enzyme (YggS family)
MTATPQIADTLPDSLQARYQAVRERIAAAAAKAGRRDEIVLVAVTKFADPEKIRQLIDLGHRDFGENKVQQLLQRTAVIEEYAKRLKVLSSTTRKASQPTLFGPAPGATHVSAASNLDQVRWHMIGHLQRNKVRKIIDLVRLIHSVDSLRLAEEVQHAALRKDQVSEVLLEVNVSGEESKFGIPVPAAMPLAEQIETMANVRVRGIMTMAPIVNNPDEARVYFARARELFEEMRLAGFGEGRFNILSMGMSGDYEAAILEGANVVRVGSAIFGEPKNPPADSEESDEG